MEESGSKQRTVVSVEHSKPVIIVAENSIEIFILKELKALGATQIVSGVVQLTFGIPLIYPSVFSIAATLGVMWWTGAMCFLTGIFNMMLHNTPNRKLVRATMLVNGVNSFVTGGGIALYLVSALFTPPDESIYQTKASIAITVLLMFFALVSMSTSFAVFVLYCKHIIRS